MSSSEDDNDSNRSGSNEGVENNEVAPGDGGVASGSSGDASPSFEFDWKASMEYMSSLPNTVYSGIFNGIGTSVKATNNLLANIQSTTRCNIQKPITNGLHSIQTTSDQAQRSCRIMYERRHEFAPYYVIGAALGVGGLASLAPFRKGRLASVCFGVLAGTFTYVSLSGPLTESPTLKWQQKLQNTQQSLQQNIESTQQSLHATKINLTEKLRELTGATNNSNKKE